MSGCRDDQTFTIQARLLFILIDEAHERSLVRVDSEVNTPLVCSFQHKDHEGEFVNHVTEQNDIVVLSVSFMIFPGF